MRAGRLDRRIDIQRKTVTQDNAGQEVETWAALVSRRAASVGPLRGEERFSSEQFIAKEQVEFRVRYSQSIADLNPLDRVIYPALEGSPPLDPSNSQIYDVMAVHEIGRREGLIIRAARRAEV